MAIAIRSAEDVKAEQLGGLTRRILFSPSLGNSQYMRLALMTAEPGAQAPIHTHRGNEALFTLQGENTIDMCGKLWRVRAGCGVMVPPDTEHHGTITSQTPWRAVTFYCDECPALAAYRAAGGVVREEQPKVVAASDVVAEQLGDLRRSILFTPSRDGVNFIRLAFVEGPPGAKGAVHTHLGNECIYTISGQATLRIAGEPHVLNAGHTIAIPPDTEHPLTVTGAEKLSAVAAYCDDCPALKSTRT